jgi:hypothetical protein
MLLERAGNLRQGDAARNSTHRGATSRADRWTTG